MHTHTHAHACTCTFTHLKGSLLIYIEKKQRAFALLLIFTIELHTTKFVIFYINEMGEIYGLKLGLGMALIGYLHNHWQVTWHLEPQILIPLK